MRKLFIVVVLGLICSAKVEAKKIKGKILFQDDTIEVIFNIPIKFFSQEPNYERLQYKVKYYNQSGKKVVIRPDDAEEIRFKYQSKEIRMLSLYNTLGLGNIFSISSNIFLKLEIDGNLKLFNYYYTQQAPGMYSASTGMVTGGYSYSVEKYILQKGNGKLKRTKGLTFKNDMISYFSDCPELVTKIENKEFRKKDIQSIVMYYNSNCK
ncbi:MAG: hypothetical protein GXO79_04860 [Chlorobi bacterium]|nr:hypothetical protein [Chlorobiota bacterium]